MGGSETGPGYEPPRATRIKRSREGGAHGIIIVFEDARMTAPQAYALAEATEKELRLAFAIEVVCTRLGFELRFNLTGMDAATISHRLDEFFKPHFMGIATASARIVRMNGARDHMMVSITLDDRVLSAATTEINTINKVEAVDGIISADVDKSLHTMVLKVTDPANYDVRELAQTVAEILQLELRGDFIITDTPFPF